jgi:hypothetical protein
MDRFSANTFRTLGIILISIFVLVCSIVLLLLALCAGMLGAVGGTGHHDPQTVKMFYGSILGAVAVVAVGVLVIAKLAKGIVREPAGLDASALPVWAKEPSSVQQSEAPPLPLSTDQPALAESRVAPPAVAPLTTAPPRPTPDVVTHLSPASRSAIQRLIAAIAVQVVLGTLGWQRALHYTATPFHLNRVVPYVSGFATNLPYLVLLLSLLRRPGRRAFAYALTIPSILLLSGFAGVFAMIFYLFRTANTSSSLLSFLLLVPWALHILILYLAWKAIRLTGILPNPARLIAAAAVTVVYYTLLPAPLAYLTYVLR